MPNPRDPLFSRPFKLFTDFRSAVDASQDSIATSRPEVFERLPLTRPRGSAWNRRAIRIFRAFCPPIPSRALFLSAVPGLNEAKVRKKRREKRGEGDAARSIQKRRRLCVCTYAFVCGNGAGGGESEVRTFNASFLHRRLERGFVRRALSRARETSGMTPSVTDTLHFTAHAVGIKRPRE